MRLVPGQNGPQMRFTENEHTVEDLSAQGSKADYVD
jgi:hypothetical protein